MVERRLEEALMGAAHKPWSQTRQLVVAAGVLVVMLVGTLRMDIWGGG